MLEVPEALLEERRRKGVDRWDELWEGVLHMVPPPGGPHQRLGTRPAAALLPAADRRGLVLSYQTGLFAADDDYRQPDIMVARPGRCTDRGVDAAELVIENRSPGDETYEKLPWYAARVREIPPPAPSSCTAAETACRAGRIRRWRRHHG